MHATIQKPIDEIVNHIQPNKKVFIVGCNNCAWKCHSGGDNVLLLTGDHIHLRDHKEAKQVFDLDSVQLVRMATGLRNGKDIAGNTIENQPDMVQGVHIMPLGWTDIVPEILKQSEIDIRQSAFNWRLAQVTK